MGKAPLHGRDRRQGAACRPRERDSGATPAGARFARAVAQAFARAAGEIPVSRGHTDAPRANDDGPPQGDVAEGAAPLDAGRSRAKGRDGCSRRSPRSRSHGSVRTGSERRRRAGRRSDRMTHRGRCLKRATTPTSRGSSLGRNLRPPTSSQRPSALSKRLRLGAPPTNESLASHATRTAGRPARPSWPRIAER